MNQLTTFRNKASSFGAKVLSALALSFAAVGSAMAAADPTTPILAEIATGKGYGVTVAVALVAAGFAIGAIYMARKKS